MSTMQLLKVTAHMKASPVVIRSALNLDGLLVAMAGTDHITRADDVLPAIPSIPVGHGKFHEESVFYSSDAIISKAFYTTGSLVKRKTGADIEVRARKVHRAEGFERDVLQRISLTSTPAVVWYVWGIDHAIQEHLDTIDAIGALRAKGYGRVDRWTIDRMDGTAEDTLVSKGVALRAIPATWCTQAAVIARIPVRPPYWNPSSYKIGVPSGMPCTLHEDIQETLRAIA